MWRGLLAAMGVTLVIAGVLLGVEAGTDIDFPFYVYPIVGFVSGMIVPTLVD